MVLISIIFIVEVYAIDTMINYDITGGNIVRFTTDVERHSLVITMTADHDGSIIITLSRALIDAKIGDQDDTFFVLVDDEEVDYEETTTSTDRTLTIQFPTNTKEIEIIGSTVNGDYFKSNPTPVIQNDNQFVNISDTVYNYHTNSIKTHYYDLTNVLKDGIKSAENTLSVTSFENFEAKKKINTAWSVRWMAWESHGKIESNLKQAENYLKNGYYKNSYNTLLQIDQSAYLLKKDLYAIVKEVKDAQILEKKYQEKSKSCILFWCYGDKDTYSGVESKIKDVESKLKTIESKLSRIESEKNNVKESIYKYKITDKNLEIKKLESLRKQEQYQAEQERQRLEEQNQIDSEKSKIRLLARNSPLIQGLVNGGTLTYYFTPLENYVSQNVRVMVESMATGMNGQTINGVTLKRVYSNNADFTINWVKDYQEETIGRQVGDYLIVGLGNSECGEWKPFDAQSVAILTWHEIGHALGQDHSNNVNNIMYPSMDAKYEYDYDEKIILSDGYWKQIGFCHSGSVYFSTERVGSSDGYKVYVIGSNVNPSDAINLEASFYFDCSGYDDTWKSFSRNCNVEQGSSLVIYNPSILGAGSDIPINVKIIDKNTMSIIDTSYEKNNRYFSQEYLNYVKTLFK